MNFSKSQNRKTVAVFFGGKSPEHEISIISARAVLENIDRARFVPLAVFVDRNGNWKKADVAKFLSGGVLPPENSPVLAPVPASGGAGFYEIKNGRICGNFPVDAAFPLIHGSGGEDGTIQGVFETWNIPYVGARTLGSAVASDKLAAKQILTNAGLPVTEFAGVEKNDWLKKGSAAISEAARKVGLPCFIKPSNLGSSIGIYKAKNSGDARCAAEKSFEFSETIIFEAAVRGAREIEVSVAGIEEPQTSVPGEIIPAGEFYDYSAKYCETGSRLKIPAPLPAPLEKDIRTAALKCFSLLRCEGMARVDFLLDSGGRFFVSELNTIPGFTPVSMYPKLWEASGIASRDLISKLIDFAFVSAERKKNLKTDFLKN